MKKIVIIDDDRVTLTMLQMLFTKSGFLVYTALDGSEGLELVKKEKPDLLISDMLIPKVDGLELCRRIKDNPELKDIKIILITAVYKGMPFKFEARECGAEDFIEKPIDTAKLIERVKVLLSNDKEKDKEVEKEAKDEA